MDNKRGIGKNNQIPWHLSSDLKRFKSLTMGHHIIMGRRTYESIGRQLPGRKMLILSNRPDYEAEGALVFHSIQDTIKYVQDCGESEVFIIGGGEIYEQTIKFADRIYLTMINTSIDTDVYFPEYDEEEWKILQCSAVDQKNGDEYAYIYQILERKNELGQ
jgi:dihydrofolate reductase